MEPAPKPKPILRLDEDVVNRIAAGEVLQRPENAVKEMLENSLDAGASSIVITIKDGGLKLIQIQDNGSGIRKEDLPIVCERFTSSKLQRFEDLRSIATYGFRGEALASISHVARVTITTMTAADECAWRATYADGKLIPARPGESAEPKPCAGVRGTQITVEDLFWNVPLRRKAFRSTADEYQRIVEVVGRYAVQNAGVCITCKRAGEATADVHTTAGASTLDVIRALHGPAVARELIEFRDSCDAPDLHLHACISNANYAVKKTTWILFINKRLVDSGPLRRALERVYAAYLPKGTHPFLYLSLRMPPAAVDVNVHPTKSEVHFLHEERVVEFVQRAVGARLVDANLSRTFYTQVRASPADQRNALDALLSGAAAYRPGKRAADSDPVAARAVKPARTAAGTPQGGAGRALELCFAAASAADAAVVQRTKTRAQLTSVNNLLSAVESDAHAGLHAMVQGHVVVGAVDAVFTLVQHGTRLYLLNMPSLTRELVYQEVLRRFQRCPFLRLSEPAPVRDLLRLALDSESSGWMPEDGDKDEIAEYLGTLLAQRAAMLRDYFSLDIDDAGRLAAVPLVLPGLLPRPELLPMFVLRLGTEVDWDAEQPCLHGVARELGELYALPVAAPPQGDAPGPAWLAEHVLLPAMRRALVPPARLASDGSCVELTNLSTLYKVFERC